MSDLVFVDTNVLLYERDARDPRKHAAARRWLEHLWNTKSGRLSFQVLSEFFVAATQKLKPGLTARDAREYVRVLATWNPALVDERVFETAWRTQERYRLSFWDALIVAAAQLQGCRYLLSEDLQDGQALGAVTVLSPFAHAPEDLSSHR